MEAIDCAATLTAAIVTVLKADGVVAVGRYLTGDYALTPTELTAIHNASLSVFLIFETNPTTASYFTYNQGISDAAQAITAAVNLRAPNGIAIYFTVDFDAQSTDMGAIVDYFQGVGDGLGSKYLLGVYGSYAVMQALDVDRYWQTYAWSGGEIHEGNDIYQYQNDTQIAGISVDLNEINYGSGCWPEIGGSMNYLVLYYGDADLPIAADLALKLNCPIVQASFATPALLAMATTKYQVGGSSAPSGVALLAGADRWATMKAVLGVVG
ncbi:conserved hypothetical protein [Candidatus Desulfosporosinus infrequens]|uniref:Rv2525c-like glycoside hydrolase-like domain-containing protein n=1 Tax=Candidatus Desulfosporosinus infrequens TaxID=2043169 RepID=A0A2U3LH58_9FIRM|nr:conserved hypothetical protein [Candidatus Desulfosporosinus infrequens]